VFLELFKFGINLSNGVETFRICLVCGIAISLEKRITIWGIEDAVMKFLFLFGYFLVWL
jgi:hypothetical protein